uniref:Uncharacterized protein n=1 Tax=Arundo donax TaxID=35708 RepID=A0A0A9CM84_ARUDO
MVGGGGRGRRPGTRSPPCSCEKMRVRGWNRLPARGRARVPKRRRWIRSSSTRPLSKKAVIYCWRLQMKFKQFWKLRMQLIRWQHIQVGLLPCLIISWKH